MGKDYPVINEVYEPTPLVEKRIMNERARADGVAYLPFTEDHAEQFRLVLNLLRSIDCSLREYVDAHRVPSFTMKTTSPDPPDEVA